MSSMFPNPPSPGWCVRADDRCRGASDERSPARERSHRGSMGTTGWSVIGAVVLVSMVLSACSLGSGKDVGATPDEQLCTVLEPLLEEDGRLATGLEAELGAAVADPGGRSADLGAITIGYKTWQDSYDELGDYEPAIRFAAEFVVLATDDLIGPGEMSDTVARSAAAIDAAVQRGTCRAI